MINEVKIIKSIDYSGYKFLDYLYKFRWSFLFAKNKNTRHLYMLVKRNKKTPIKGAGKN